MLNHGDTLTAFGHTFRVSLLDDFDNAAPWENEDGHGPVRITHGYRNPTKRPGERPLHSDGGTTWLYDWQAAHNIAKRGGWGLGPLCRASMASRLGREPSAREVRSEAVRRDFEFLRAWLRNDWAYIGVTVALVNEDGEPLPYPAHLMDSLWGIESNSHEYIEETANDLAQGIAWALNHEAAEVAYWGARDVLTEAA